MQREITSKWEVVNNRVLEGNRFASALLGINKEKMERKCKRGMQYKGESERESRRAAELEKREEKEQKATSTNQAN